MKSLRLLFVILGFMSIYMTGCGGSSNSKTASVGACGSGYVYSAQYGCMESAGCQAGYGWYGGTCVAAGGMGNCQGMCPVGQVQTQMGCLPQDACPACYGHSGPLCYISTSYNQGGMYPGYPGGGYPGYPY